MIPNGEVRIMNEQVYKNTNNLDIHPMIYAVNKL